MDETLALSVRDVRITYRTINPFRLRRIKKDISYQKVEEIVAVDGVSFDLDRGKILGIIGKNGSGKSTLLKAIAGIFSPDEGMIDLMGNKASLLAMGVGFQTALSGYENIYLSGLLLGFSKKQIEKKEQDIIAFSELGEFVYKPIDTYSSGMRTRLAFSISAILDADIILVDEALSVGDVSFKDKSYSKLQEKIQHQKTTVIIVTHSQKVISDLCDEVIWLHQGKIKKMGSPKTVVRNYLKFMKHQEKKAK